MHGVQDSWHGCLKALLHKITLPLWPIPYIVVYAGRESCVTGWKHACQTATQYNIPKL